MENGGRDSVQAATPVLSLRAISKSFDGVEALKSVNLDLYPGEVLGLVGDNGAGKSTLIKILSGLHPPDKGQLFIAGQEILFRTYGVHQARQLGVETVYQDRSIGEMQPLWRNVFIGRPITNRLGFIRVQQQKQATLEILKRHVGLQGDGVSADARVRTLSGGERQGLCIGRAMHFDSRIIILDEPTTALALKEVDKVLSFVDRIAGEGKACIYISHNMRQVHRVAHRIMLIDRGRVVAEYRKGDLSLEELGARLLQISASADEGRS